VIWGTSFQVGDLSFRFESIRSFLGSKGNKADLVKILQSHNTEEFPVEHLENALVAADFIVYHTDTSGIVDAFALYEIPSVSDSNGLQRAFYRSATFVRIDKLATGLGAGLLSCVLQALRPALVCSTTKSKFWRIATQKIFDSSSYTCFPTGESLPPEHVYQVAKNVLEVTGRDSSSLSPWLIRRGIYKQVESVAKTQVSSAIVMDKLYPGDAWMLVAIKLGTQKL
jgi:hypothetical protein